MNNSEFTKNTIEAAIRLVLLFLLAYWCFILIRPFLVVLLWAVIIAVAIFPIFTKLKAALGGRNKLASALYTLVALAILITPAFLASNSILDTSTAISERYAAGSLDIPPPADSVKDWPLVGEKVYSLWAQSSDNLESMLGRYKPELKKAGEALVTAAASIGGGILQFVLSIIISGILVANAAGAYKVTSQIFSRLINLSQGQEYADLTKDTIRSVAQGVLGVAAIQAVLSAVGMIVMGVPAWGLWSAIILVLAIAQLPPILVLGFVAAYVFSVADTTPAVIFAIYCLIVSGSDGFLKPLFLGRGMNTPMLVILLGAIGGMITSGIIGLFVGAIILALGYELFMKWLGDEPDAVEQS
ncbi:MAG: AI-2E family transporter [Gammaproteobacteria bacterium]|nr:AI-2E family transporter [Gammaproteobacteria bacterium]